MIRTLKKLRYTYALKRPERKLFLLLKKMMVIFKGGFSYAIYATAIISVPGYIVVVLQALFSTPFNLPLCLEIHKCTLKAGICNSKVIS